MFSFWWRFSYGLYVGGSRLVLRAQLSHFGWRVKKYQKSKCSTNINCKRFLMELYFISIGSHTLLYSSISIGEWLVGKTLYAEQACLKLGESLFFFWEASESSTGINFDIETVEKWACAHAKEG